MTESSPEPLAALGAAEQHPDLIDADGELWWWTTGWSDPDGYQCRELFCLYQRAEVEKHFGPVREVTDDVR